MPSQNKANLSSERTVVLHAVTSSMSLRLLRGQLRYLHEAGFEPAVLCSPGQEVGDAHLRESVPVFTIPIEREISPLRDLISLLRIWRLMCRLRPAICNVGTPKAGLLAGLAAWLGRVPCRVYTLRGLRLETAVGMKRRILDFTEWVACACAHRVICVSPSLRQRAVELGLVRAEKAIVLGSGSSNGVDLSRFAPTPDRITEAAAIHRRLHLETSCAVIGYVGRLTRDKGLPELLRAFQRVKESYPNALLMLVGGYEEGDQVPDETREAIESDPQVIRIDFTPDIAPYYLAMDIFVLPTRREGFPNTVLEAQAAGKPVITTEATGAADSVLNNITGLLVPVGDVAELARALEQLLADPSLGVRFGKAGQERVSREFVQERIWSALADEYESMARSAGLQVLKKKLPSAVQTMVECAIDGEPEKGNAQFE